MSALRLAGWAALATVSWVAACPLPTLAAPPVGSSPVPSSPSASPGAEVVAPPRWTGLDLTFVEGLKAPRADGFTSGLTADFKGGLVRLYVTPSEQAASWWVARMATVVEKQKPAPVPLPSAAAPLDDPAATPPPTAPTEPPPVPLQLPTADELLVAGDRLVIARVGNVGVMVEVAGGARDTAEAVLAQLTDLPQPWPTVPPLERTPRGWRVPVPEGLEVRYEGGARLPGPELHFSRPPRAVVVYDMLGRASRQAFDALGLPVDSPAPWSDHTPATRPPPETP